MDRKVPFIVAFLVATAIPVLLVSPAHAHRGWGYHYSSEACADNPDWMSELPDNWHISEISIPGTHDTYSKWEDNLYVHCQMMPMSAQLQSGIRVLDVRLRVDGEKLQTCHGNYKFWSRFNHVLDTSIEFLKNHPRETILMRVAQNWKAVPKERDGSKTRFLENFKENYMLMACEDTTTCYDRWFWHPDESEHPTNPTLGEIRGKIVLLAADPLTGQGITDGTLYGLQYPDTTMDIQDSYDMSTNWSMRWKWQGIHDQLEDARTGDPETIYFNYLSGSGAAVFPYFVASGHVTTGTGADHLWSGDTKWAPHYTRSKCGAVYCYYFNGTNDLTFLYLRNNRTPRVGIIMADFPGPGLINGIIAVNDTLYQMNAPLADAGGPYRAIEGSPIVFDAGDSSDPNGDPILFRWDVDSDGTWETEWSDDPTTSYTWYDNYCSHDPNSYPVIHDDTICVAQLEVTDGTYTSGDVDLVIISNVAPTVTIDEEYLTPCIVPGQPVPFNALISDPGCLDTHTATWSFSDGTVLPGIVTEPIECPDTTGVVSVVHSFGDTGQYSVVVEVQDSDGGTDMDTALVNVVTAPEVIDCAIAYIQDLPKACFKKPAPQRKKALTKKLTVVKNSVLADSLGCALAKLKNDIRAKADGTVDGHPENDWIVCEDAQRKLCMTFDGLIAYLEPGSDGWDPPGPGGETARVRSFKAWMTRSGIELSWKIDTNAEITSFRIERRLAEEDLNGELDAVRLIPSTERQYVDDEVVPGRSYTYTLIVVGDDDSALASESVAAETIGPDIVLYQNHPNPFNPITTISFQLPKKTHVRLSIYDVTGRRITTLADAVMDLGMKEVEWDGKDARGNPVGTGVYFYSLRTGNEVLTRKMVLLR